MGNIKNVQIGDIYKSGTIYYLVLEKVHNITDEMYWCSVDGEEFDINNLIPVVDYAAVHLSEERFQLVDSTTNEQQKKALESFRRCRLERLQSIAKYQQEHENEEKEETNKVKKIFRALTSGGVYIYKSKKW